MEGGEGAALEDEIISSLVCLGMADESRRLPQGRQVGTWAMVVAMLLTNSPEPGHGPLPGDQHISESCLPGQANVE